jgi:hypothetical protein
MNRRRIDGHPIRPHKNWQRKLFECPAFLKQGKRRLFSE